jgi:hypothetical protein
MNIVAVEEIEFDAAGLSLLEEDASPIIQALRAVLDELLNPTTEEVDAEAESSALPSASVLGMAPPSSLGLAPPSSLGLAPPMGSLGLAPSSSAQRGGPSLSRAASSQPQRTATGVVAAPVVPLILVQLRSRAMRALWNLLSSKANVHAVIRAGFGPVLTSVAQLTTSIAIGDPASGRLEEVERLTDRFAELCQEQRLLFTKPDVQQAGAAFAEQAAFLTFNPYRELVTLPRRMTSDDPLMVALCAL